MCTCVSVDGRNEYLLYVESYILTFFLFLLETGDVSVSKLVYQYYVWDELVIAAKFQ